MWGFVFGCGFLVWKELREGFAWGSRVRGGDRVKEGGDFSLLRDDVFFFLCVILLFLGVFYFFEFGVGVGS